MLAKLPEEHRKSNSSQDITSNVNNKLAGLSLVLIFMLGVTGAYIMLPILSGTQPEDIATNLANNNTTSTHTHESHSQVKNNNNTKSDKNKTTPTSTVKVNNTQTKTGTQNTANTYTNKAAKYNNS